MKNRSPGHALLNEDGGFTLLELLVAMVILVVGLLGTASLVVGIINGNTAGREMTTASTLAQDKMEEIRRLTYSGSPASTTTEGYNSISGFPAFKRITQIQVNNPAASMKLVTITVLWKNDTRSTSLKTIVSR